MTAPTADPMPYPGDDPTALLRLGDALEDDAVIVSRVATGLECARGSMVGAWKSGAGTAAAHDLQLTQQALTGMHRQYTAAQAAVHDYHAVLIGVRSEVDALRDEQTRQLATLSGLARQYGRAARTLELDGRIDAAALQSARTALAGQQRTARSGLDDVQNRYRLAVRRATQAADACSERLRATVNVSAGHGVLHTTTPLAAVLGLSQLVLPVVASALALSRSIIRGPFDAAAYQRLQTLLEDHGGDAGFAVAFLTAMGPTDLIRLAGSITSPLVRRGGVRVSTLAALQRNLGVLLSDATATVSGNRLPAQWLTDLLTAAKHQFEFDCGYTMCGLLALGTLMHTGVFPPAFLRGFGDALMARERALGARAWVITVPTGESTPRLWLNADGLGDPGTDPYRAWMTAMVNNGPQVALHLLVGDPTLLRYLLVDRAWPDYTPSSGPDFNAAIAGFGHLLVVANGCTSDATTHQLVRLIVTDLGEPNTNPALKSSFSTHNWIAPGLRPYLATVLSTNIDYVHHLVQAGLQPGGDSYARRGLYNVLADLGKDADARTLLAATENRFVSLTLTTDRSPTGMDAAVSGVQAATSISTLLTLGQDTAIVQHAATSDAHHNAYVATVTGVVQVAVTAALSAAPSSAFTGAAAVIGGGKPASSMVLDSVAAGLKADTTAAAAQDAGTANLQAKAAVAAAVQAGPGRMTPQQRAELTAVVDTEWGTVPAEVSPAVSSSATLVPPS